MRSISIRKLVVTVLMAGTALAAVTAAPAAAAPTKPADISPILECVFHVEGTADGYVALWGYLNRGTNVDVPIGKDNFFGPGSENRGQPTSFLPGRNKGVFTTRWNGSDLTWTLTGLTATANKGSEACKENPVPVGSDSPQAVVLLGAIAAVLVIGGGIVAWFTKRRRRPATA
jgi:hypothetical protein